MRKLILSVFFSLAYIGSASADFGLNFGVSGQAGIFAGSGKESNPNANTKGTGYEHGEAAWGSVFVETTSKKGGELGKKRHKGAAQAEPKVNKTHGQQRTRLFCICIFCNCEFRCRHFSGEFCHEMGRESSVRPLDPPNRRKI